MYDGLFIWHELIANDTKAAAAFYGKVARLKTQGSPSQPHYTMFVGSGMPMAGLVAAADAMKAMGTPPNWLSFIGATDVDDTARRAESLGGKITSGPGPVPDGGRYAVLQDPQGATFAIYGSRAAQGEPPPDVPLGHMSWHELATTSHVEAFLFYQNLFGWVLTGETDMGPLGSYKMFAPAGAQYAFGGMYTKAPGSPGRANWLPYLKVIDARPATATARKNGAQILAGPMQVPNGGWISMGIDPQGALFAVHSTAPAKKKTTKKKTAKKKRTTKGTKKKKAARGRT